MKKIIDKLKDINLVKNENQIIMIIMGILFFVPFIIKSKVIINVVILIELYILLVSSLNVINGYSGQFSVGQAAFYCVGAYTAGILSTTLKMSFWLVLPISGIVAAISSLLLSIPTAKLRGNYFTIVTLGMCEVVRLVCVNWKSLTRGPKGISGIPSPVFFGIKYQRNIFFFYVLFALCCLMLFLTSRILKSRVGRAWLSIRENQDAASSLGIDAAKYKTLNLAYSAFWAGVAGCIYAYYQRFIAPEIFSIDESFNIMTMNVIGGQGTLLGPIVGSIVIKLITEAFRSALQYRMLIYSALIIIMMWVRPQGLVGAINQSVLKKKKNDNKGGNQNG